MKNKFLIPVLAFSIFFVIGVAAVTAQTGTNPPGTGTTPPGTGINPPGTGTNPGGCNSTICIENPFKVGNSLYSLMRAIVNNIILPIGGVLAVLSFIYSGFLYVTAQGNESKLKTANTALLYTAIGTAVLLGSWVLANVVCQTIAQLTTNLQCPT